MDPLQVNTSGERQQAKRRRLNEQNVNHGISQYQDVTSTTATYSYFTEPVLHFEDQFAPQAQPASLPMGTDCSHFNPNAPLIPYSEPLESSQALMNPHDPHSFQTGYDTDLPITEPLAYQEQWNPYSDTNQQYGIGDQPLDFMFGCLQDANWEINTTSDLPVEVAARTAELVCYGMVRFIIHPNGRGTDS